MKGLLRRLFLGILLSATWAQSGFAQTALTWQEVRQRFEAANPTLRAGQIGIDESKAQEITAFLRPNPNFTLSTDGTQIAPFKGVWQPFTGTQYATIFSYLHERQHKRELRLESQQKATGIAVSVRRILIELWCSHCGWPSCKRFRKKRSWNWRRKIFRITTTC